MSSSEDVQFSTPSEGVILATGGQSIPVVELDSYGFHLTVDPEEEWDTSALREGQLELNGSYRLPIQFQARRRTAIGYRCSLHDLTLAEQGTLDEMVQELGRNSMGSELQDLSYDQIAAGQTAHEEGTSAPVADAARDDAKPRRSRANLIGMLMVAAMILIVGIVATLVKGRSSLELHNGSLAGNYIPLSADMDSEVAELFVKAGDSVTAGQPLYRLTSRAHDSQHELAKLELDTASAEQQAARTQVDDYAKQMDAASRALAGRLAVVRAELEQAKVDHSYAAKQVERLRPLSRSGAVKPAEFDAALALRDSLAEAKKIKEANIAQLDISIDALGAGVIVDEGGSIDDRKSELDARLSVANARLSEAHKRLGQVESLANAASVVAPADGTVYSLYRSEGEFVRAGDPVLSLSGAAASWALGHIDAEQATKVHPGQTVFVNVPSAGVRAEGRVVSVGHRGLYAQGGWSADFRATSPTDVPIKVQLPELPVDLPSGIRLDMVVTLEKVWPWQKRTIKVEWPGGDMPAAPERSVASEPKRSPKVKAQSLAGQ